MRILSNDYLSNVVSHVGVAHGGPAHFAQSFSEYVVKVADSEWIGLVQDRRRVRTRYFVRRMPSMDKRIYYGFSTPSERLERFAKEVAGTIDPEIWFAEELRQIRCLMKKTRPDVLFLNGFSLYAWLLLCAAKEEGLPIVIQHAGIAKKEFDQYKHLYTPAFRKVMLRMERDIPRWASKQIFLNEYSRAAFESVVGRVPAQKSTVIPLPYNKLFTGSGIAPHKKAGHKDVRIGCVARWDRIKKHEAVLHLAKMLKVQHPTWEVLSVTRIPSSSQFADFKHEYRSTVTVCDPMSSKDLKKFYQSVDLLILPSHFDVSPGVVMEAALCGVGTLISPSVGWVSAYTEAGLGDWVVDFTDPQRVIQTVEKLLKQGYPSTFTRYLLENNAPKHVFRKYMEVFSSVIL